MRHKWDLIRVEQPIDRELLRRMSSALRHRGPDGDGEFIGERIGLAHRRLSIIDVEGGSQPIANEDGQIQVVFNGEIYNFVELREELEAFGHIFKTRSDTEVIVHAYEQWGRDCVRRFNGMFALALWDGLNRELFIARDHLGIKPLYYVDLGSHVLFASEIKALLEDTSCPRAVDTEALGHLFTFRYVPSPKTLFRDVRKLPPGHYMTLSGGRLELRRFWTWAPAEHTAAPPEDLIDEYQALLEDAIKLQLRSDVPLGLFLSSGIDSGALLALMSLHSPGSARTFTIGFEGGEASNEVDGAREMARMFGATHEYMTVTSSDYRNYYDRYLWELEEPVGNETAAAFHFVSELASRSVKVALTGQGADKPWAGYDRYVGAKFSQHYSRMPATLTSAIEQIVTRVPGRSRK